MAHFSSLIVVVLMAQGLIISKAAVDVPAPELWKFVTKNSSVIAEWKTVESRAKDDPVIGYKARRWRLTPVNVTVYEFQDGELVATTKEDFPLIEKYDKAQGVLTQIDVPVNQNSVVFEDMHRRVEYEFRVAAYTKRGEGPMSAGKLIRLG